MKKQTIFLIALFGVLSLQAMEPSEGTAQEQLQNLTTQELPLELQFTILDKMIELPFPRRNRGVFAQNYLNFLMSRDADLNLKKMYLNKFAKQWYLIYGKELKIPATWIECNFPVLSYGFSIAELLKAGRLPQIKISTTTCSYGTTTNRKLNLSNLRINSLEGLQQIPNIKTITKLNLEKNKISEIPSNIFGGLDNLIFLNLVQNDIHKIIPGTFSGLNALHMLFLNDNKITTIPTKAFSGLNNVFRIMLNSNPIRVVEPNAFAGLPILGQLYIGKVSSAIIKKLEQELSECRTLYEEGERPWGYNIIPD